jgi:uncharacterized RDD family membrane protein YckC
VAVAAPSLRRRLACLLYESMLLFGIAFAATLVFSIAGEVRSGMDPRRPLLIGFLAIVFGMYFAWCWSKGQTLAMRTWKIRILGPNGGPPSQPRALFRYACSWLWVLPPLAFIAPMKLSGLGVAGAILGWMALWALLSFLHPERQFWHDALAGTRLAPADEPPAVAQSSS